MRRCLSAVTAASASATPAAAALRSAAIAAAAASRASKARDAAALAAACAAAASLASVIALPVAATVDCSSWATRARPALLLSAVEIEDTAVRTAPIRPERCAALARLRSSSACNVGYDNDAMDAAGVRRVGRCSHLQAGDGALQLCAEGCEGLRPPGQVGSARAQREARVQALHAEEEVLRLGEALGRGRGGVGPLLVQEDRR